MRSYFELLRQYGNSDILPLHMPGHKRKAGYMGGIGKFDVTEVTALDDLHHADGIIAEAEAEAAAICGSRETRFLVNGATGGILAAIAAVTEHGDRILVARNCHKSAVNAIALLGLEPLWLEVPKVSPLQVDGSIDPAAVETMLREHGDIKAVFVVSPTYEGVVSDVEAIAAVAHRFGLPLIVDAAHGAHFRFGEAFPVDAVTAGADLVVESLHKTLPALTQTAVLHANGSILRPERLDFALQAFQSSSPSHLLIASAIECFRIMATTGRREMARYAEDLDATRRSIAALRDCELLAAADGIFAYDPGKVVFGFKGHSGTMLHDLLLAREHIETEMATSRYLLAMTSLYDTGEDLLRFAAAVAALRRQLPLRDAEAAADVPPLPRRSMLPAEALTAAAERCSPACAVGRVAAATLYLYPPGTPLIVAGEVFDADTIAVIEACLAGDLPLRGLDDGALMVVKEGGAG